MYYSNNTSLVPSQDKTETIPECPRPVFEEFEIDHRQGNPTRLHEVPMRQLGYASKAELAREAFTKAAGWQWIRTERSREPIREM